MEGQTGQEQVTQRIFSDPNDLNTLVLGGANGAWIDGIVLYEAKFSMKTPSGIRNVRWIFRADSDLEAAWKVWAKRDNPEFWTENFVSPCIPRRLIIEGIIKNTVECISLTKIMRDLYLRAVHFGILFEEYGEIMLEWRW